MNNLDENTFISHLEALRNTLLHCVLAIIIVYPLGFLLSKYSINLLVNWSLPTGAAKLNFFSPMEVFIVQLKISLIISIVLTFPYIVKEVFSFLLPALYDRESRFLKTTVFCSSFLFLSGVAFCIAFILPLIMKFSLSFASSALQPMLGLSSFVELAGALMLAFGLMFQFPLFVVFLVYFELISIESLEDKRPYIIIFILILAAILTPPDVISQLFLGVPTYLLFELGLLGAKKLNKLKFKNIRYKIEK